MDQKAKPVEAQLIAHKLVNFASSTQSSGASNDNFRNICCKISCLRASPRIFDNLKYGIISYF